MDEAQTPMDALDSPDGLQVNLRSALAEVERLRRLVGDETYDAERWANCDRAEAIRQANEKHEAHLLWVAEHDARRDERDAARAEASVLTDELGDMRASMSAAEAEVDRLRAALAGGQELIPMEPSIGRIVHYVSYGTPGGEYKSVCRAAIITRTHPETVTAMNNVMAVSLCVMNPEGLFFNQVVRYHDEDPLRGGTWHWPERVDGSN